MDMGEMYKDLRKQNEHGYTVLHELVIILVVWGSLDVAKSIAHIMSLIDQDPGLLDIKDNSGLTALCHAKNSPVMHTGHTELLENMLAKSNIDAALVAEVIEVIEAIELIAVDRQAPQELENPEDTLQQVKPQDQSDPIAPLVAKVAEEVDLVPEVTLQKQSKSIVTHLVETMVAKGMSKMEDAKELKDYLKGLAIELKDETLEEATYIINSLIEGRESIELFKLIMDGASAEAITNCIEAGLVDVNARTFRFNTPLHLAVKKGDAEAVKCLLEHGADKSLKNFIGRTPLDKAIKDGNQEIIECLSDGNVEHDDAAQPLPWEPSEDFTGILHEDIPVPSENE